MFSIILCLAAASGAESRTGSGLESDETLEDMLGNELSDLGKNILAFVHNQRVIVHNNSNSFQIKIPLADIRY